MRHQKPLAKMADMWRERCHKAERERDLARRDYECMNKFREHAEDQRDQLREALEEAYPLAVAWMGYYAGAYTESGEDHPFHAAAIDKARAALKATEEG